MERRLFVLGGLAAFSRPRLKLTAVELVPVRATARTVWLLLRLRSDAGVEGLGEASDAFGISGTTPENIAAGGAIESTGSSRLNSGGAFTVETAANFGDGTIPVPRPVVSTKPQTIYVVTGYNKVDLGVIQVPEITLVTTTEQREVAADSLLVGRYYNTMDVSLVQDAYYNANAPAGKQIREYFIEGIDYRNDQINWAQYGVYDTQTSDYTSQNYRTFSQLTDLQRSAVMRTLGYVPLYNFFYGNARTIRTLDGNVSSTAWTPAWANNPPVIYSVDVAGWNGKAIRMPRGANEDVLRVVSQGSPYHTQEYVGGYRNVADVVYTQDRTDFSASTFPDPATGNPYPAVDSDVPPSPAHWAVSYVSNGLREYSIMDGREYQQNRSVTVGQKPQWQWELEKGNFIWDGGFDVNSIPVSAPSGYLQTTDTAQVYMTTKGEWVAGRWFKQGWFPPR